MRLVVDANILVAELLRKRGRDLIISKNLELFLAEKMKDEVQYELQKRIAIIVSKTNLTQELGQLQLEAALRLIDSKIITFPLPFYQFFEAEARKRIPRDPNAETLNPVTKLYIDKHNTPITSNFKLNGQFSGTSGHS